MPLQMSHEVPAPVALLNSGPPILAGVLGVGGAHHCRECPVDQRFR